MEATVLDRLLALSDLLQRDMGDSFAADLTESRVHALWVLHHLGPSTQQAMSQALRVTPRSVSALVDALEAAGYVTRSPHPEDRRAVLVALTPGAASMMARMQRDHTSLATRLLEAVAAEDRDAFERGLDAVLGRLRELVASESVSYGLEEERP
ncbi:MarR family transcriptional regulator [Leucobacter sp. CSA1]|uniref:MarR family transcriptional regulator n=1 Tax=Leucobacter chromiisoli TaxID=2796471 RepID=A0A934Q7C4_9MICO|nr:MarR family transcriptional regulator [Leucobacter chromiisoli]MBK0418014.1 MarR family transcriptional regulator [Leucobacter chromiisoli]